MWKFGNLQWKRTLTKKQKRLAAAGIGVMVLAAVLGGRALLGRKSRNAAAMAAQVQRTAQVTKSNLVSSLSSSGTLSPKDTYNLTSLVSGEVIVAEFEEGHQVEKGQVLYVIDSSSMESELRSAQNSVERAKTSYELAVEDYQDAASDYSGNTYKATESGYIKNLYVKAGDKVSGGTKLADIYSDRVMKIRVPFLSGEAALIGAGNEGLITLSATGEQIGGVVTSVSNMEETLSGGRLVRYVTLEVQNPGGLSSEMAATVQLGDFRCVAEGTFDPTVDTVMTADVSGSVEIQSLLVQEGDYISDGAPLFRMTDKTAENLLRSYENAMDQAKESLEAAESKLENTQDSYDNYTVTAPISGQVITKNVKAGDKISAGGSNAVTLATIYDLSELQVELQVDELDVQSVSVGQTVILTADAFEGETFTGTVTNVSLAGSNSNGVTNYPVMVTLTETGNLLPGMNVDGTIVLDQAEDVLTIPVDALMRGNRVYVKDDTVKESDGAVPAGFRAVEVETGLMNDEYVEIVSGLSEGDEVYVAESTVSGDGMGGMNFRMEGGPGGGGFGVTTTTVSPGGRPSGGPSGGPGGGMP